MSGYGWRQALERMKRAEAELTSMAEVAGREDPSWARLMAKREGVALARSYLEEVEDDG